MSVSRPQPPTGWHTPIFWFCGCRGRNERVTYADDFDDKVAALEARLAEAETHRDKNRETAISAQQWVIHLEARCVQLEDNLRIAVKVGLDDQARIAQLEAALLDLYSGTAEYVYLNHLGDPHNTTTPMRNAAKALGAPALEAYDRLRALTASETKAEPTLICPKCGVNRYRQTCGGPALDCPIHGEPQAETAGEQFHCSNLSEHCDHCGRTSKEHSIGDYYCQANRGDE